VALYGAMIIEMLSVIVVSLTKGGKNRALFPCSAAVFGLLINVMCLLLGNETMLSRPQRW